MHSLRIAAPAKVNLFLHITGKRPDGYHLLDSLVAFTDFGDSIEITPSEHVEFSLAEPFASFLKEDLRDNLVIRAARLLQAHTGCTKGAHIALHKYIPVGAGLGGGSSDAAAALLGLQRFWNVNLTDHELQALALQLGSDVPVCLLQRTAHISGIGEQVTPMPIHFPAQWIVLVNPNVPLLTADVYRSLSLRGGKADAAIQSSPAAPALDGITDTIRNAHNALEVPAIALLPIIADILNALNATKECTLARMSGSGATCFGLYAHERAAQQASADIQQQHSDWWVQPTHLLG